MESDIKREVYAYLKERPNIKVWRVNAGHIKSNVKLAPDGIGDIEGFVRMGKHAGLYINFEIKQPGKKLRKSQVLWQAAMSAAGAHYWVVHALDEAKAIYEEYYES